MQALVSVFAVAWPLAPRCTWTRGATPSAGDGGMHIPMGGGEEMPPLSLESKAGGGEEEAEDGGLPLHAPPAAARGSGSGDGGAESPAPHSLPSTSGDEGNEGAASDTENDAPPPWLATVFVARRLARWLGGRGAAPSGDVAAAFADDRELRVRLRMAICIRVYGHVHVRMRAHGDMYSRMR